MKYNKYAAMSIERAVHVGPSKEEWMRSALELFLRTNPDFDGYESNVEMIESDEANQEGHGQILARRDNVIIRVPFFVSEGKLQPLDVFYMEDQLYPMSKERVDDVFFNVGEEFGTVAPDNVGASLDKGKGGPAGYSRVPGGGDIRPYDKQAADLLEKIIEESDPENLKLSVERASDDQIKKLVQSGREDVFHKMASVTEEKEKEMPPTKSIRIKMAAPGYYHVEEFAESKAGDPFPNVVKRSNIVGQDGPEYIEKVSQENVLDRVDLDGWAILPIEPDNSISVGNPVELKGLSKIASGDASLWRSDGKVRNGVICVMHEYNGDPTEEKLFIGMDEHAIAPEFFGESKQASDILDSIDIQNPTRQSVRFAKLASWVWKEEDGSFHATRPFPISQQLKDTDGSFKIAASDSMGRRINFHKASVSRIAPQGQEKTAAVFVRPETKGDMAYYVPDEYRLIALGDRISTMSELDVIDGMQSKQAQDAGERTEIVRAGSRYRVMGTEANKVSASTKDLTRDEMLILLATHGTTKEAQDQILDALQKNGQSVDIYGIDWDVEPDKTETLKVARDRYKIGQVMDVIQGQRDMYWKIASEYSDMDLGTYMTDTALSLDLAEENQIDDFIDRVPLIEESIKTCAELLVQARMGNIEMVPEDVRDAMMSMEKVVQALRGLDAE